MIEDKEHKSRKSKEKLLDVFEIEGDNVIKWQYYEKICEEMIQNLQPDIPDQLIFLDLEGTGYPDEQGPSKITEIGLYSITTESFLKKSVITQLKQLGKSVKYPKTSEKVDQVNIDYVRCSNMLNILIKPGKTIRKAVSKSSGIFNEDIDLRSEFSNEHVECLKSFFRLNLATCKNPCLIAHNGKSWDFRMFRKLFEDETLVKLNLEIDTCDSRNAFKKIDKNLKFYDSLPQKVKSQMPDPNVKVEKVKPEVKKNKFAPKSDDEFGYSLTSTYKRLFEKTPVNSHTAIEDCKTTAQCALFYGLHFLNYVAENKIKLKF